MTARRIYSRLRDLLDVTVSSPSNGQVLTYNNSTGKWENQAGGGGSQTLADVLATGSDGGGTGMTNVGAIDTGGGDLSATSGGNALIDGALTMTSGGGIDGGGGGISNAGAIDTGGGEVDTGGGALTNIVTITPQPGQTLEIKVGSFKVFRVEAATGDIAFFNDAAPVSQQQFDSSGTDAQRIAALEALIAAYGLGVDAAP